MVLSVTSEGGERTVNTDGASVIGEPSSLQADPGVAPRFGAGSDRVPAFAPVDTGADNWVYVTSVRKSEAFALANTAGQTVVFIVADSAQFSAAVSELAEDSYVGTLSMLRLRSLPESVNPAGGRG